MKTKRPREKRQIPLNCKYWHKGMAKTNYRKLPGRFVRLRKRGNPAKLTVELYEDM